MLDQVEHDEGDPGTVAGVTFFVVIIPDSVTEVTFFYCHPGFIPGSVFIKELAFRRRS